METLALALGAVLMAVGMGTVLFAILWELVGPAWAAMRLVLVFVGLALVLCGQWVIR